MKLEWEDPKAGFLPFPDMVPSIGVGPDVTPWGGLSVGAQGQKYKGFAWCHLAHE